MRLLFYMAGLINLIFACGPKEKGHVRISAMIDNKSSKLIIVRNLQSGRIDTVNSIQFFTEKEFNSPSKPLCCPCSLAEDQIRIDPLDTSLRITKDFTDPMAWSKNTIHRNDIWECRFVLTEEDFQKK